MIFAGYKTALDTFASEKEIENVMKILLTKCKLVIITLGAKGAAYANRESGSSSYRKVDAPILPKGAIYLFYCFNSQFIREVILYMHFAKIFCYFIDSVVDTTGAGDAFTGALIFFLVEMAELDVGEAIKRACYVASISVQKEGTQSSYPVKEDLPKWLLE